MLRVETADGWLLITHPDHARLAGAFASKWGNAAFQRPRPREKVLRGIACHDDGWAERDSNPSITRQGKPSAFSIELVGKYAAFEEIDMEDYLAVREAAVRRIAQEDPYAALLISMHTFNLLTERADRSTIRPSGLVLLDKFLDRQCLFQSELGQALDQDQSLRDDDRAKQVILDQFHLLQACDNLSLLSCVAFDLPSHLLHPLRQNDGSACEVQVLPVGVRHFRLVPWPFVEPELNFYFPARKMEQKQFSSPADLVTAYHAGKGVEITVTLTQ